MVDLNRSDIHECTHGAGAVRAAAGAGRGQRERHHAAGQGGTPRGGPHARLQGLRGEIPDSCALMELLHACQDLHETSMCLESSAAAEAVLRCMADSAL